MKAPLALFATLGLLAADPLPPDAIQKEYARFEGTWRFSSFEIEGMKQPASDFKNIRLVLKGDQWTLQGGPDKGTFKIDPTKNPKQIDVLFAEGPEKGKTALGIYELEGDRYTVCLGLVGRDRPTQFVSKPGSGHVLEVLRRVKP